MNILTIDFDAIMHKDIPLYESSLQNIEARSKMNTLNPDQELYQQLTNYLQKISQSLTIENIYFIENHDQACDIIARLQPKVNSIHLINIDFHYDAYVDINNNDAIHCGNWVNWVMQQQYLNFYTWLNFPQSMHTNYYDKFVIPPEMVNAYSYSIELLNSLPHPNYIILCLSPEWIPEHIQPLFYDWIALLSREKNYEFELVKPGMIYKNMV